MENMYIPKEALMTQMRMDILEIWRAFCPRNTNANIRGFRWGI